ncbi:MAG: hypothetical protein ABR562_08505, partial [Thermoplasmatota archaeon]
MPCLRRIPAVVLGLVLLAPALLPASSAVVPLASITPGQPRDAFQVALDALDNAGTARNPLLRTQRVAIEGARMLLDALPKLHGDDLHRAAAWAKLAEQVQYHSLDIPLEATPVPHHATPSEAAEALVARHGGTMGTEGARTLAQLDSLSPTLRGALTRTIDAFLGFEEASDAAFAHPNIAKLDEAQGLADRVTRGERLTTEEMQNAPRLDQLGARWGLIPPARDALLDAAVELHDALLATPQQGLEAVAPVDVPGVAHIDLTTSGNVYTKDYALLIDAGGNDIYLNNAGGGNGEVDYCTTGVARNVAAALLDFGGNERFGDGRSCGANGGGAVAAGFLLHGGGTSTYTAGRLGVNGGGYEGAGFLVDAGGDGSYVSVGDASIPQGGQGANGGAEAGIGFLVDLSGDDEYRAAVAGVNGGSDIGAGMLVDGAGNDRYVADTGGVNGGGDLGQGFLIDLAGINEFVAGGAGANGGGNQIGTGLLVSADGDDTYSATGAGTNGGANYAAVGTLIDLGGDDSYMAGNG